MAVEMGERNRYFRGTAALSLGLPAYPNHVTLLAAMKIFQRVMSAPL